MDRKGLSKKGGDALYRFSDERWISIESKLRDLPHFENVKDTARQNIEASCHELLHAKRYYTSRAPDVVRSIEDFRKAEDLSSDLISHLNEMLRRRNEDLLNMKVIKNPYFIEDNDYNESSESLHQSADLDTPLTISGFTEILIDLNENLRWIREHLEGDKAEYDLKRPGPRVIHDEYIFFNKFVKTWVDAGGQASIGYDSTRVGNDQFYGPALDFIEQVFQSLANGEPASNLPFRIPERSTLRKWCAELK